MFDGRDYDEDDEIGAVLLADAIASMHAAQPPAPQHPPVTGITHTAPDKGISVTYQQPGAPAAPANPQYHQPTPPAPAPVPGDPNPQPQPPAPVPQPPMPAMPQYTIPPAPAQQAPPQSPPATGGPGQPGQQPVTGEGGDVYNYPPNTALAQMSPEQQAEYWRHKSRKHEDRVKGMGDYDQLKEQATQYQALVATTQSEHDKAVAEARRQGQTEAMQQAGGQLVEQWVRAAVAGRLPRENEDALISGLDRNAFLTAKGVDTDKVHAFVNSIIPVQVVPAVPAAVTAPPGGQPAPVLGQPPAAVPPAQQPQLVPQYAAPPRGPDFGQGQPNSTQPTGLAAGREIARQRFPAANPAGHPAPGLTPNATPQ